MLFLKMPVVCLLLLAAAMLSAEQPEPAGQPSAAGFSGGAGQQSGGHASATATVCEPATLGSPFITVDSWVYPAMLRLYGLGFVDRLFVGMRPWTRASITRMLEDAAAQIEDADPGPTRDQAQEIYESLAHELRNEMAGPCGTYKGNTRVESVYTIARGISGLPLNDSYHLGSTITNDYGRPYANGFNSYTGASGYATAGRFTLYVRGEFSSTLSSAG